MPTTANKGYNTPAYNTLVGTWGTGSGGLNETFGIQDNNLGGVASVSLSNANVTLSSAQAQNLVIKLSGTLLANVTVYSPIVGFCIVENNTSGAYTVTWQANFGSGNIGSGLTLGQGARTFLVSDTSAGVRVVDTGSVPSGTRTVYYQASAPTGWSQVTSYNDYAFRVVSGTGGGATTLSRGFSAGMGSINVDGHAITISEMPSHNHLDSGHAHSIGQSVAIAGGSSWLAPYQNNSAGSTGIGYANIGNTGGDSAHVHSLTIGISYLDLIICQRN